MQTTMQTGASNMAHSDDDLIFARKYAREVKIATDEWHDNPFNPEARAAVQKLLDAAPAADAAWTRAQRSAANHSSHRSAQR